MSDAETVFRTLSGSLGERLKRMPDGETGPRSHWIGFQYPVFKRNAAFVRTVVDTAARAELPAELQASRLDAQVGRGRRLAQFRIPWLR